MRGSCQAPSGQCDSVLTDPHGNLPGSASSICCRAIKEPFGHDLPLPMSVSSPSRSETHGWAGREHRAVSWPIADDLTEHRRPRSGSPSSSSLPPSPVGVASTALSSSLTKDQSVSSLQDSRVSWLTPLPAEQVQGKFGSAYRRRAPFACSMSGESARQGIMLSTIPRFVTHRRRASR